MPNSIDTVEALDELLSRPSQPLVEMMSRLPGDLLILGVGGKMGPTLARMARRASDAAGTARRILGVSRFSSPALPQQLRDHGIEPLTCDLLDEAAVAQLPEAPLIISMSGFKFGAQANPSLTWAMNCLVPAVICRRFPCSRIVAFSSGNIYPHVRVESGGCDESTEPRPLGEYAMTVLGRERVYEYYSRLQGTPLALLRLNYAVELRYGVLVDLAQKVWRGEPIDLTVGFVNVLWQGEANDQALRMLEQVAVPPQVMNLAGSEMLSVRALATELGKRLDRAPRFQGTEGPDALLNNARRSHALLGAPQVGVQQMLDWIAPWVASGGASLGKPTHFEARDGRF